MRKLRLLLVMTSLNCRFSQHDNHRLGEQKIGRNCCGFYGPNKSCWFSLHVVSVTPTKIQYSRKFYESWILFAHASLGLNARSFYRTANSIFGKICRYKPKLLKIAYSNSCNARVMQNAVKTEKSTTRLLLVDAINAIFSWSCVLYSFLAYILSFVVKQNMSHSAFKKT